MRRSSLGFSILVVVVGLVIYMTANAIASQRQRSRAPSLAPVAIPLETVKARQASPQETRAIQMLAPVRGVDAVSQYTMTKCQVGVEGRTIHVQAIASMYNIRRDLRFVWAVRVLDSRDVSRVFFSKFYDDQLFSMPESHELTPTFEDSIELNILPGKYLVEVAVYEVPAGWTVGDATFKNRLNDILGPIHRSEFRIAK